MSLRTYNDYIARIGNGYWAQQPVWAEIQTTPVNNFGSTLGVWRCGDTLPLPSPLPTGVTAYILTAAALDFSSATRNLLLAKLINFGSVDIGTGTFTDGSAMPTVTECGVSRQLASPILTQVTTAMGATQRTVTVTYVDQDGNAAEAAAGANTGASAPVGSGGLIVLNSPDWGARDITAVSVTGSASSGVVKFWGLIPLCVVPIISSQIPLVANLLYNKFNPVRMGAGDTLGVFPFGGQTTGAVLGNLFFVGDS